MISQHSLFLNANEPRADFGQDYTIHKAFPPLYQKHQPNSFATNYGIPALPRNYFQGQYNLGIEDEEGVIRIGQKHLGKGKYLDKGWRQNVEENLGLSEQTIH